MGLTTVTTYNALFSWQPGGSPVAHHRPDAERGQEKPLKRIVFLAKSVHKCIGDTKVKCATKRRSKADQVRAPSSLIVVCDFVTMLSLYILVVC